MITAVSFFAFRRRISNPYLMVGWLWFMVTLLPVIGLVQVGMQSMADRYTYISLTGLFYSGRVGNSGPFPASVAV